MILESMVGATAAGVIELLFSKLSSKPPRLPATDELLVSALVANQSEQAKRLDLLQQLVQDLQSRQPSPPTLDDATAMQLAGELGARLLALAGVGWSSLGAEHQEIFVVHAGNIRHRWWWQESGWSGWHDFQSLPGGALVASVTAGNHAPGYQDLFAVSIDGRLFHTWFNGPAHVWAEWEPMDGPPAAFLMR